MGVMTRSELAWILAGLLVLLGGIAWNVYATRDTWTYPGPHHVHTEVCY